MYDIHCVHRYEKVTLHFVALFTMHLKVVKKNVLLIVLITHFITLISSGNAPVGLCVMNTN